jgi:hypothetical protein
MMVDEQLVGRIGERVWVAVTNEASYAVGRNDALRELAKYFDGRIEQAVIESVARDATVIVEQNDE